MESIRARCSRCLMKSMFVFRQQNILLGSVPTRLLQTHMEVICSNSSASGERNKGGGEGLGILGMEISFEMFAMSGIHL